MGERSATTRLEEFVTPPVLGAVTGGRSLIGVDWSGRNLAGSDLQGVDLSRADLRGADLTGANLRGATLFEARLDGANLLRADLRGADLSECCARKARLGATDFSAAVLFGADLQGATLAQAHLTDADLRTATLAGANLRGADLRGADLQRSNLQGADLGGCRVRRASFADARLSHAGLRGLDGYDRARWVGADIRDVDFSGIYLIRREIMDQNYLHEFKHKSRGHRVLYYVWWLTSDCGRSFLRWGTWTLVLTVAFAGLYGLVELDRGDHETFLTPLYYSVVTLTSLGYGDVVPATPTAQVVAMAEVLLGYGMLGGLMSIFANKMARRAE